MISTSSSTDGYSMRVLNRKRSNWASGSGYVPSNSMGFCVASTKNGLGSVYMLPRTVQLRSCIASSSALCVFGGVRLISSASRMLPKMGPCTNVQDRERVQGAAHRTTALLHSFEQRALRFWGRTIDFVGQQDVTEDGALHERPGAASGGGVFLDDVRAGDVAGHQVGGKLDASKNQAQRLSHGAHQQGLSGAGEAGDQTVAAHKQGDHHLIQHLLLAHADAAHLRHDLAPHLAKALDARFENFRLQLGHC